MSHSLEATAVMHLAVVIDNQDPQAQGRVQVKLHSLQLELWAMCMTNSAGAGYGVSCLPKINEQVVVSFISPEICIVLGAIWSGEQSHPEIAQEVEDNYVIKTPAGSVIKLQDESQPSIRLETTSGYQIHIDEAQGGEITIEKGTESIRLSTSGITINSASNVTVKASNVEVNAPMVKVNAAISDFSGVVKCDSLISNSVISASYTPGAGNIW